MAVSPVPKSRAQAVIEKLFLTANPDVSEFELNKWYDDFKKRKSGDYFKTPEDCIAWGLILFALKKYDLFVDEMQNARRYFNNSKDLFAFYLLAEFLLEMKNLKPLPGFDLYHDWFNDDLNKNNEPFVFRSGAESVKFLGKKIVFKTPVEFSVELREDKNFYFHFYDFSFSRPYSWARLNNLEPTLAMMNEYITKLRTGTIRPEERELMQNVFREKDIEYIHSKALYSTEDLDLPDDPDDLDIVGECPSVEEMFEALQN